MPFSPKVQMVKKQSPGVRIQALSKIGLPCPLREAATGLRDDATGKVQAGLLETMGDRGLLIT